MKFLIAGTREQNSGKTTVATGLLSYFKEIGIKACGFKPRAGNSIWYDFEFLCKAFSEGRCYGKDAHLLRLHSGIDLPEEVINPIHRLWAEPPSHVNYLQLPPFICDRVRTSISKKEDMFIINTALPFVHGAEDLLKRVKKKIYVSRLQEFNKIILQHYERSTQEAHKLISKASDIIVYESYCDIALPWNGIRELYIVLVVEPGYISAYESEKYLTALQLLKGREVSTKSVIEYLNPLETVRVAPSKSNEIMKEMRDKLALLLKRIRKKGSPHHISLKQHDFIGKYR